MIHEIRPKVVFCAAFLLFQKTGLIMGNFVGKAMEDSMQRNQQFMTEINRFVSFFLTFVLIIFEFRTTLERQIQMQDQMRERAMAMQVSKFVWRKLKFLKIWLKNQF